MNKKALVIAMMTLFVAFAMQTGFAQDKQNKKDDIKIADTIVETELTRQADLAMGLVDYGYANKSALSLLQAAEIFAQHPMVSLKAYDSDGKPLEASAPIHSYAPEDLLKDAKFYAKNDAELLAYIGKVEKEMNNQTKAETIAVGALATISLGPGRSKTITLETSPFSYNRVKVRSNDYSDLRMCVSTSWEEKGCDTGTCPVINFLVGLSGRVFVTITNLESSSTTVEISHIVVDSDDVSRAFE